MLMLLLLCAFALKSQHIYVRSITQEVGGWIVSAEGETLYEIPAGWFIDGNREQMMVLDGWPVLCQHYPRRDTGNFAFLHENGRWEELSGFDTAKPIGENCYGLGRKENRNTILWCPDQQIELKNTSIRGQFNKDGLIVGRYYGADDHYLEGLLSASGEWMVPASASLLVDMGHQRFLYRDTLEREYLLQIKLQGPEIFIDTVLELQNTAWALRANWPFDETGHSWAIVGAGQLAIIDTSGTLRSDTIHLSANQVRPFDKGLGQITRPRRWLDTKGKSVMAGNWKQSLAPSDGRMLVLDTVTELLGYLDLDGNWAISPGYCYATSFRDGLAATGEPHPQRCLGRVRQRSASGTNPAYLTKRSGWGYYELIDTTGKLVFQDSCRELFLLPGQIIGRNQSISTTVPAIRIDWLSSGNYWLSPDYHFSNWEKLQQAPGEDVERIDIGTGRYQLGLSGTRFPLPNDFAESLSKWPKLKVLTLDYHAVSAALPVIVAIERLEHLSMARCSLSILPSNIGRLRNLTHLDISSNDLEELPNSIYQMRHLEELNVADNPLPPETILRLRKRLPTTKIIYKREW